MRTLSWRLLAFQWRKQLVMLRLGSSSHSSSICLLLPYPKFAMGVLLRRVEPLRLEPPLHRVRVGGLPGLASDPSGGIAVSSSAPVAGSVALEGTGRVTLIGGIMIMMRASRTGATR